MRWNAGHDRNKELFDDHADPCEPADRGDDRSDGLDGTGHSVSRNGPEGGDTDDAQLRVYRGHEYVVRREPTADGAEFVLYVDERKIATVSQLKRGGFAIDSVSNWTVVLERYAEAFIDALENGRIVWAGDDDS